MDSVPLGPDFDENLDRRRLPKTLGQKVCITTVLALLAAGLGALLVSCCWGGRPPPHVPMMPAAPQVISMPPVVRVVVARSDAGLSVSCHGGGTWYAAKDEGYETLEATGVGPWTLGSSDGRLAINGAPVPWAAAELRPAKAAFELDGQAYRGRLLVKLGPKGTLTALNLVQPEHYLRSVVGSEMYTGWPLDALMAQAVAARSYLIYAVGSKGYLSRLDLAYKGVAGEHRAPNLAVELTGGIVLTYDGRILPAYFHSTCGGQTASAAKVFGEEPMGPLGGVTCNWCRASTTYEWRAEIPASRIAEALKSRGVRQVRSILPQQTEPDGYARFVLINDDVRLDANAFRLSVGPGQIKSTRFGTERAGESFVFEGHGFGHGAGLCQWGANGLAEAGRSWQEILEYYYPGAELRKVY